MDDNFYKQVATRLRRERERLGRTQTFVADATGVTKRSQIRYEAAESAPDTIYFERIARAGFDVGYILTGIRTLRRPGMAQAEIDEFNALLEDYWNLSNEGRSQARNIVGALVLKELHTKGHTRGIRVTKVTPEPDDTPEEEGGPSM